MKLIPLLAVVSLAIAGCGGGGGGDDVSQEDVLATINGVPLTRSDIDERLSQVPEANRSEFNDPNSLSVLIDREVRTRVLAQAAMDDGITETEEFKTTIESAKMSILADIYSRKLQDEAGRISEKDLREAYERDKHIYSTATETKARHILCSTEEGAREALEAVKGGMPFEQAVERYSIDNYTNKSGGDLGALTRDKVIPGLGIYPEFVDALVDIDEGGVGGPIHTRAGYHVVQVVGRKEGSAPSFEEVQGQIKRRMEKDRTESGLATIMERLWKEYNVTINSDAIKRYIGYPVTPEDFMRHLSEVTASGDKITLCTDMVRQFPENKYSQYALFYKGFVYSEELHNQQQADLAFRELLEKYPNSNYAPAARWMLQNMGGDHPPLRNVEDVLNRARESGS